MVAKVALLAFLMIGAATVLAEPGRAAQTSTSSGSPAVPAQASPVPPANAQNGKELYLKYSCYACHGYDGHGGAGARLVPMRMNLPGFTAYVHSPRQMPPYTSKVLSDAQLADLFAYIRSLPESPSPKNIPLLTRIMGEK